MFSHNFFRNIALKFRIHVCSYICILLLSHSITKAWYFLRQTLKKVKDYYNYKCHLLNRQLNLPDAGHKPQSFTYYLCFAEI